MKPTILLLSALLFVSYTANCQNTNDVPKAVNAAFSQKFPDASHVKWSMENNKEWEAEFKIGQKDYSANFDLNGAWLETEYTISTMDIPEIVKKTLVKETDLSNVKASEITETKNGKSFEFVIKDSKGKTELVVDDKGNIVSKEQPKKETEEKD